MATSIADQARIERLEELLEQVRAQGGLNVNGGNLAFITADSPTNSQGNTATVGIIALVGVKALYTGIFDYSVSAKVAAAAADVSTWTVTSQTGTGAMSFAGSGAAKGGAPGTNVALISTGAAGTPITISTGGGGSLTQSVTAKTIGTAAVGDAFAVSGVLHNSVTVTGAVTPFPIGNNVFLCLTYANSVADRAISNVVMAIRERRN